jgi:predicted RNA binding protein YcfA (HicA-like mRNA interferase family)
MQSPRNIRYAEIERVLLYLGFERLSAKGSHVKWKHRKLRNDIIIPVHDGECKHFYKILVSKAIKSLV